MFRKVYKIVLVDLVTMYRGKESGEGWGTEILNLLKRRELLAEVEIIRKSSMRTKEALFQMYA